MRIKLRQSREQCLARCDRHGNSGCSILVNGEKINMCSKCEKHVFTKGDGTTCQFGVCSPDACKTGCSAPVEAESCKSIRCGPGYSLVGVDDLGCGGECIPETEPCLMVDCAPGKRKVGADSSGCGGTCVGEEGCCEALTSECLACSEGLTLEEYCEKNPKLWDCPERISDSTPDKSAGEDSKRGNLKTKDDASADHSDVEDPTSDDLEVHHKYEGEDKCSHDKAGHSNGELLLSSMLAYLCGIISVKIFSLCKKRMEPDPVAVTVVPVAAVSGSKPMRVLPPVPLTARQWQLQRSLPPTPPPIMRSNLN